jgi:DNA adenine methylase
MKLRPVVKIHGGKYYLSDLIIRNFPIGYENMTYVEGFGGAASVLLNKKRSVREIYSDLHAPTANMFHVLVSQPNQLVETIRNIVYKEDSFKAVQSHVFQYGNLDSAVAEIVLRRMSRGGMKKTFSWSTRLRGGQPGDLNAWETFKDLLPKIAERLTGVEIRNESALSLVPQFNDPNSLIYLDPPYLSTTRSAKSIYDCEMTDEDHRTLGQLAGKSCAKVMVSGYDSPLYQELYNGWRVVSKEMPNNSGQGKVKQRRLECLWMNY